MAQESFSLHVLHGSHAQLRNPLTGAPLQSICRVRALRPDLSAEDNEELRALWSQELAAFAGNSAATLGLAVGAAESASESAMYSLQGLDVRAPNPMSATLLAPTAELLPPPVPLSQLVPQGWGGEEPHALDAYTSNFRASVQSITDMLARMNASMEDTLDGTMVTRQ